MGRFRGAGARGRGAGGGAASPPAGRREVLAVAVVLGGPGAAVALGGPGAALALGGAGAARAAGAGGAPGALLELSPAGRPPAAPPVALRRRRLDRALATLLLRSGYESLAEARFVPMDRFQRRQFLRRQDAQEAYIREAAPLRVGVGDVSDPLYFDLIAFAQWATAGELLRSESALEFEEFCEECPGRARLVSRPAGLEDDARLPAFIEGQAADRIYARLRGGFEGTEFAGVPPPLAPGAPFVDVLEGVRGVLGALVERGYALSADVRGDGQGRFQVALEGPASLWALQTLAASPPATRAAGLPAHDALAVGGFLRASGLRPQCFLRAGQDSVEEEWRLLA